MNEQSPSDSNLEPATSKDVERTNQVTVAGWTAGLSALFALGCATTCTTWPAAFAISSVVAMVAAVCYFMLKR